MYMQYLSQNTEQNQYSSASLSYFILCMHDTPSPTHPIPPLKKKTNIDFEKKQRGFCFWWDVKRERTERYEKLRYGTQVKSSLHPSIPQDITNPNKNPSLNEPNNDSIRFAMGLGWTDSIDGGV